MLIRFLVKNLFSFKELTEFNMLPGRSNRLSHHVIKGKGIDLLKLNAIYGANGAGKSNLIDALFFLKKFVVEGSMPVELLTGTFKLQKGSATKDVYLGIEFIKNDVPYYYGLTINQGIITEEELQISGLGKTEDRTLFLRTDNAGEKDLNIRFSREVEADEEARFFPSFLKNEILERNKPVLYYMRNRQNRVFEPFRNAAEWFEENIEIIKPNSKPKALVLRLETNKALRDFSVEVMKSFQTGIEDIHIDTLSIEDYFGEDKKEEVEKIVAQLHAKTNHAILFGNNWEEVVCLLEDGKPKVKKISFSHGKDNDSTRFTFTEESDGTRRLMEYLPLLFNVINNNETYIIDEIERSLHPLLIKELIKKFSHDENTRGQLIFSTHESNLLDQDIFRADEIWFAEKNKEGATELYTLSEFKEHHTIDIRKGYLHGRYGGIPFLGNLKDLNWEQYAKAR